MLLWREGLMRCWCITAISGVGKMLASPACVGKRLATLLANDMNLFAYHLPLDAHPEWGNNAQLGKLLGWLEEGRFGDQESGLERTLAAASQAWQPGA
jgi:putative NIF3 family GTP cyclohydrolase 1 type 2